ncbi:phosphate acyltransferase PlsX [Candidatus Methylomirabilis sp.]|uniref:phosphate acyltransferase PlsX n=1 Tax=Candidatus Methylomirabilis sp. TaxID=2032687 RepID=UPI002A655EDB|nr:phosphate acyltransferase PlsX [Candidatus Methylomirabilis sp.]
MGTRIALDAMGGDQGPIVTVEGAVAAAREFNLSVLLVGNEDEISQRLKQHATNGLSIAIRHAPETVGMQESPSAALRKKKQSSIRVGLELVKSGEADAFISAGNTGAVMATALITLGPLPGVERPAIALIVPTLKGQSLVLDVGANADCKARHLLQFAIMGDVYARQIMGKLSPTVGLLSIGEEESKGNELTREAFRGLEEEQSLNFIGNVEGREVLMGTADVIVCDGFTGNIALKIIEGAGEFFTLLLKEELGKGLAGMAGALLARGAFKRFKKLVDYTEYGGAPLLGVRGVCIIGHGRSTAKAIKNAIRAAAECVENRVIEHIIEGIAVS